MVPSYESRIGGQVAYSVADEAVYPNLHQLDLPFCNIGDDQMEALLAAAPALQQLTVCSLPLECSYSDRQWTLQKIHFLLGNEPQGVDTIRTLTKLPLMPQLRQAKVEWDLHVSIHKIRLGTLTAAVRTGLLERIQTADRQLELVFKGGRGGTDESDVSSEEGEYSDDDETAQLLSSQHAMLHKVTLLRPLIRSAGIIHITQAHITPDLLHALHVVHACEVRLHRCTWDDSAVSVFWAMMPCISEVRMADEMDREQLNALCMAANRPVAVMVGPWFDPEDHEPLMSSVQAAGGLVTLTRGPRNHRQQI